jgi:diguanylate cyclase (GGDEF)-like protein
VSSTNWTASAADDRPTDDGRADDPTAEGAITMLDPSTGLDSPSAWRRAVDDEVVRLARYHRPATVMLVELDGFERLTERLGEPAGARLVLATARAIQAQSRAADRCARFGRGRFAILLPETDEIKAINFAERIRSECDRWLEAGEVAMRVAMGWATLDSVEGATPAILEAENRLDSERRQRAGSAA